MKLSMTIINSVTSPSSRNVMGDYQGKTKPQEIVVVSGHVDGWSSEASQDDGVGVILSLEVPRLLKKMNLNPKRTIRSVFWTSEEMGLLGSMAYVKAHKAELANYSAMLEADLGCFKPMGYLFDLGSHLNLVVF